MPASTYTEWLLPLSPDERRHVPGWLVQLLDKGSRAEVANAAANCSTRYYIRLLSQRADELERAEQRPRNRGYEIVHSYTGEVICEVSASCPADALALVSDREGFADPRSAAAGVLDPEGDALMVPGEYDFYVLRPDGLLGMIITNYEVHAVPMDGPTELEAMQAENVSLGLPPIGPPTREQAAMYDAYEAYHVEMEAEYQAQQAAGGRTICPKCEQRSVTHRSVVTLGYAGHPGAEYSDLGECETPGCGHKEL